jgi:hypothetical protein
MAQTAATAAGTAASTAQTTANTANSAASAAETELAAIANANILTAGEKPQVIIDYQAILNDQTGNDAQAVAYGVSHTAYDAAITALTTYLTGLTPAWNNTAVDTPITGSIFQADFLAVYSAETVMLNAIYTAAKTLAANAQTSATAAGIAAGAAQASANNAQTTANNIVSGLTALGGGNLLMNSSFESGSGGLATNWGLYNNGPEGATTSFSTTAPILFGAQCQRVSWTVNNNSTKGLWATTTGHGFSWQPGGTYALSYYARATGTNVGQTMELAWNVAPGSVTPLLNPPLTTSWQRYAFRLVWGASVDNAFYASIGGSGTQGTLDFDGFQVELGSIPTGYSLNPADAMATALSALSTATGKAAVTYASTAPSSPNLEDLWVNTSSNNQVELWNGTAWVVIQNAAGALATANAKAAVWYGGTAPTTASLNDLWVNTSANYQVNVCTAAPSTWTLVQDSYSAQQGVNTINSTSTMAPADQINFMQSYAQELGIQGVLDSSASGVSISSLAYDNAVTALAALVTVAYGSAGWKTTWPSQAPLAYTYPGYPVSQGILAAGSATYPWTLPWQWSLVAVTRKNLETAILGAHPTTGTAGNATLLNGYTQAVAATASTLALRDASGGLNASVFNGAGIGLTGTAPYLTAGNASLLVGYSAAFAATASTVALRDSSGGLTVNALNAAGTVQSNTGGWYVTAGGTAGFGGTLTAANLVASGSVQAHNGYFSGQLQATATYSTYTADGLFGATALPSYISMPSTAQALRFGYSDAGSGQYVPRIGFYAPLASPYQVLTMASIGLEPASGDFTIRGGPSNAEQFRIYNANNNALFQGGVTAAEFVSATYMIMGVGCWLQTADSLAYFGGASGLVAGYGNAYAAVRGNSGVVLSAQGVSVAVFTPSGAILAAGISATTGAFSGQVAASGGFYGTLLPQPIETWSSAGSPNSIGNGITSSLVSATQGFPSYGSLLQVNTYPTSQAGTLQLFTPYSPTYGGNGLQYRTFSYDTNAWTPFKTIYDSGNINTSTAAIQALQALINAPQIASASYTSLGAINGVYPPGATTSSSNPPGSYLYAPGVVDTAGDGTAGTLYQNVAGVWTRVGAGTVIAGKIVAGNLSVGVVGAQALAANIALVGQVIQSAAFTSGGAGVSGMGISGNGSGMPSGWAIYGQPQVSKDVLGNSFSAIAEFGGPFNFQGYQLNQLGVAKLWYGLNGNWIAIGRALSWVAPSMGNQIGGYGTSYQVEITMNGGGGAGVGGTSGCVGGGAGAFAKFLLTVAPGDTLTGLAGLAGSASSGNQGGNTTLYHNGVLVLTAGGANGAVGGDLSGPGITSQIHTGSYSTPTVNHVFLLVCAGANGGAVGAAGGSCGIIPGGAGGPNMGGGASSPYGPGGAAGGYISPNFGSGGGGNYGVSAVGGSGGAGTIQIRIV